MMKRFVFILIVMFFISAPANSATLTDINPPDNIVDNMSVEEIVFYPVDNETTVLVEIAENTTIPYEYEGLDGFAVVNESRGFFDLEVRPEENGTSELDSTLWTLKFNVQNESVYSWSGFHFEFFTIDFGSVLDVRIITGETSDFDQTNFSGVGQYDQLHFWSTADVIAPGEMASFLLWIDFTSWSIADLEEGFGLRQFATVATAVPVPGTVWLMGLGMIGVWGIRRKK